jgi:peptidoglycan hydrolase FlgJ
MRTDHSLTTALAPTAAGTTAKNSSPLREAAQKIEASFIAEMLKSAGVGQTRDSFGGGAGEDGFASFLVNEQANKIVAAGGFGLAEHIFESLKQTTADNA